MRRASRRLLALAERAVTDACESERFLLSSVHASWRSVLAPTPVRAVSTTLQSSTTAGKAALQARLEPFQQLRQKSWLQEARNWQRQLSTAGSGASGGASEDSASSSSSSSSTPLGGGGPRPQDRNMAMVFTCKCGWDLPLLVFGRHCISSTLACNWENGSSSAEH
jgi:hypothetical protein